MSGELTYWIEERGGSLRSLKLTVCSDEDPRMVSQASLRRLRLGRILSEAAGQGVSLTYHDLAMILLVSRATIKRDVSLLRLGGQRIEFSGPRGRN